MKRLVILAAVVVAVVVIWWVMRRGGGTADVAIDLVAQFPSAEKRSAGRLEDAFALQDVTIKGESRRAVFMHPTSRLIYKITVPDGGWVQAWLGIREDAWDKESDGVLFRIGISDGREHEELVNQHVDPRNNPGDRRWIPVTADLSAYAGQQVDLIINTNTSLPGKGDNGSYDWAVIGDPSIVVQR